METKEKLCELGLYSFLCNAPSNGVDVNGELPVWLLVPLAEIAAQGVCVMYAMYDKDNYQNDGMAHCMVACRYDNCISTAHEIILGKLGGKIMGAGMTAAGALIWEVIFGWKYDSKADIVSGLNGILGSLMDIPCEEACKAEQSHAMLPCDCQKSK